MSTAKNIFKNVDDLSRESDLQKKERRWHALEFRDGKFKDVDEFGRIHMLKTEQISVNSAQPRRFFDEESLIRLADSIRLHGILQPITVRRIEGAAGFEVIAGERRLRAAKLLSLETVPCIIITANERQSTELAIIENLHRENLNLFEQASAIAALIDLYGLTQEEVAKRLSVSQSFVANKLRILRLTMPEREKILKYDLTERHARALLCVPAASERMRIIDYIYTHGLTVAATESYIGRFMGKKRSVQAEKPHRRIILKDIRVFYNSVDRAISTIKQAGVNVETTRTEEPDATVLTIRIPSNVSRETLQQTTE